MTKYLQSCGGLFVRHEQKFAQRRQTTVEVGRENGRPLPHLFLCRIEGLQIEGWQLQECQPTLRTEVDLALMTRSASLFKRYQFLHIALRVILMALATFEGPVGLRKVLEVMRAVIKADALCRNRWPLLEFWVVQFKPMKGLSMASLTLLVGHRFHVDLLSVVLLVTGRTRQRLTDRGDWALQQLTGEAADKRCDGGLVAARRSTGVLRQGLGIDIVGEEGIIRTEIALVAVETKVGLRSTGLARCLTRQSTQPLTERLMCSGMAGSATIGPLMREVLGMGRAQRTWRDDLVGFSTAIDNQSQPQADAKCSEGQAASLGQQGSTGYTRRSLTTTLPVSGWSLRAGSTSMQRATARPIALTRDRATFAAAAALPLRRGAGPARIAHRGIATDPRIIGTLIIVL